MVAASNCVVCFVEVDVTVLADSGGGALDRARWCGDAAGCERGPYDVDEHDKEEVPVGESVDECAAVLVSRIAELGSATLTIGRLKVKSIAGTIRRSSRIDSEASCSTQLHKKGKSFGELARHLRLESLSPLHEVYIPTDVGIVQKALISKHSDIHQLGTFTMDRLLDIVDRFNAGGPCEVIVRATRAREQGGVSAVE